MLRLFETGATSYQPEGLIFESGDPLVTDANIHRLLSQGFKITDALVSPCGVLFLFSDGRQYYSPALRLGADGLPTEKLAEIAAEAGFGDLTELLDFYSGLPADFKGQLPDVHPLPDEEEEPAVADLAADLAPDLRAAPGSTPDGGDGNKTEAERLDIGHRAECIISHPTLHRRSRP